MARYPKAFEEWYLAQIRESRSTVGSYDEIILRMKWNREVATLAEGERRLRKMLYVQWQWQIATGRMRA